MVSTEEPVSKGRRHQLAVTFVNKLLHESGGQVTIADIERLGAPAPNVRRGVGFERAMIIAILKAGRRDPGGSAPVCQSDARTQTAFTLLDLILEGSGGLITLQTIEALTDSDSTKGQPFWRDIGITLRVAAQERA